MDSDKPLGKRQSTAEGDERAGEKLRRAGAEWRDLRDKRVKGGRLDGLG